MSELVIALALGSSVAGWSIADDFGTGEVGTTGDDVWAAGVFGADDCTTVEGSAVADSNSDGKRG